MFCCSLCLYVSICQIETDEDASNSRRSSTIDDRRQSLRHVDQENLLKVRRDSKSRRPSLAEVIPDWPALQKVKRKEKVNMIFSVLLKQHQNVYDEWIWLENKCRRILFSLHDY